MKICVTAQGADLESQVDPRFGRCSYFIIIDDATLEFEALSNPAATAVGGAGIQSAQMVASAGAQAVVTGNVGPNAYMTLAELGLKIFVGAGGTVKQAVEAYKAGKLQQASDATAPKDSGKQK
ncbi:MAG: NifB/NifX family molybdenum-iron cluster-binding protein [Candidatus Saganbacteria bacterium]|nr:NifB/NifX family molybdenum-iron cluster-binding protein [Candidatus Saganbacteria bacterium]